ncbi:hypothetical protein ACFV1N_04835 [Streptosporangium canum]|uniref:hypothetical protein n=1 Tax=Streptosporangium canum TaxID=324952 RepID=UPI003678E715
MAPDANIPVVRQLPEEFQEAAEQSPAVRHAEDLAAVLDDVHGIPADVHELRSGNALVSVSPGLLAYTDGESFWWTSPELSGAGAPALSSASTLLVAAEQLAAHYAILRVRPAASLLDSELPLLADVILADRVAPS